LAGSAARTLLQSPRIADDQYPRDAAETSVSQNARALLRTDAGTVAQGQTKNRHRIHRDPRHAILRTAKRSISAIKTNVIASIVIDNTAIVPQALLPRRSNMVTELG